MDHELVMTPGANEMKRGKMKSGTLCAIVVREDAFRKYRSFWRWFDRNSEQYKHAEAPIDDNVLVLGVNTYFTDEDTVFYDVSHRSGTYFIDERCLVQLR